MFGSETEREKKGGVGVRGGGGGLMREGGGGERESQGEEVREGKSEGDRTLLSGASSVSIKRDLEQYQRDLVQFKRDLVQYKRVLSTVRKRPSAVQKRPIIVQKRPSIVPKRPNTAGETERCSSCVISEFVPKLSDGEWEQLKDAIEMNKTDSTRQGVDTVSKVLTHYFSGDILKLLLFSLHARNLIL